MVDRLDFFLTRLRERLWFRPLLMVALSVALIFLAGLAGDTGLRGVVPEVTKESVQSLLSIIASSMLVIATFSVASMVSAYASASNSATPRSFPLIVSDDISQNALSTFIGAFIFSIVALIALKNDYYDQGGVFVLFVITLVFFAIVIITFVRWVDSIARLGRLGNTIDKVEAATVEALRRRRCAPNLGGIPVTRSALIGQPVYGNSIGYVQRVDVAELQEYAEESRFRIRVDALPGTFAAPGRALAYAIPDVDSVSEIDPMEIAKAFRIGDSRIYDEDPRFGLVVLSEIASRALSPAVNDPGTAIDVTGRLLRLFSIWSDPNDEDDQQASTCERVEVPEIAMRDMFDDAFTGIARDGAGAVEVMVRLQKAFKSLACNGDATMRDVSRDHANLALARAEKAMSLPEDLEVVRTLANSWPIQRK